MNNKFYLYRWIMVDKNIPFYIGVGTKSANTGCRSIFFKNIINKTDCYWEILIESDNRDFIFEKEKEFISLYDRKNLKTGPLVNLTIGGDGSFGKPNKNKIYKTKKVYQYSIDGIFIKEWESIKMAGESLNIARTSISACCIKKNNAKTCGGFFWSFNKEFIDNKKYQSSCKKIDQYTLNGEFIKTWESITQASLELNIPHINISTNLRKKNNRANNYVWVYNNEPFCYKTGVTNAIKIRNMINNKIYNSINEASVDLGVSPSTIKWHINNNFKDLEYVSK